MRVGFLFPIVASVVFLAAVSGQELSAPGNAARQLQPESIQDDSSDRGEVVTKKVAVPSITLDTLRDGRPLSELANALDTGQLEMPGDREVDELVRYLSELSTLSDELTNDYRSVQAHLSRQQARVAELILRSSEEVSDPTFYRAARLGLAAWVNQIPYAAPEDQEKAFELVARQLEIGVKQGLKIDEVRNALRTADLLERHGHPELASDACLRFAQLIRSSESDRYLDSVEQLEEICRRLELVGKPLRLEGTILDGSKLQWSNYQDKVVLVYFWATWSLPSVVELAQLKQHYETYHPLGFEIVGVCLDSNRAEVEATVAKEQIPWNNLWDEKAGTEHPMAIEHGVSRVPTGLLVDRDGNVVSTQATGTELQHWLRRSFGPEWFLASDLAASSRWSEATNELQKLVDKYPENVDYRVALGAVQLLGNDRLGYAGTCEVSWTALMQEVAEPSLLLMPLFCLPGEHQLNRQRIYEIATKIRETEDSNLSQIVVILSAYRSQRDEACLNEEIVGGDEFSTTVALLVHAMAAQRLQRSEQASELLSLGRSLSVLRFDDFLSSNIDGQPYEHWICCTIVKLLLAEAQTVVSTNEPSSNQP